jgi:hypothetical protein
MTQQSKLYTCNKPGCNFKANQKSAEGVEFLTEFEYNKQIGEDGKVKCKVDPSNISCGMKELELHEYPKPKKEPLNIKLIATIATGVLVIGGLSFFLTRIGSSGEELIAETEVMVDSIPEPEFIEELAEEVPAAIEPEPIKVTEPAPVKPQTSISSSAAPKGTQTLNLSGNLKYTGEVMNGRPHGLGTMYYIQQTLISPKDLKKRMAEVGDYITGEFYEGTLVQGKLFDKNNELKEIITIGR